MGITRHIPNTITSMNLLSGAMGVICTFQGEIGTAFLLMLAAAVFDFCDGLAARLLKAYSPVGKELDSLSDMVSFGLLPSLMLVKSMWLSGTEGFVSFLPLFLAMMSALRLAKFNVDERQTLGFIGLPTPASAMVAGSLCAFLFLRPGTFLSAWAATPWFLPLVALVLGILLVSEVPMFAMKVAKGHKLLDGKRIVFLCFAAAVLLATLLLHWHWTLPVLVIFSFYILENLALTIMN